MVVPSSLSMHASIPSLNSSSDGFATSDQDKVEVFAEHFQKNFFLPHSHPATFTHLSRYRASRIFEPLRQLIADLFSTMFVCGIAIPL
ncbi:hypothetical protein Ciccas_011821 [Cichlidogyrus casuarinus]|uniref:Uncharacterized protein n=1 Tax=Cichlidogyrus casuarinus TaxID=1844966 RepID=A0ABD2PQ65_9PLAT